MSYMIAIESDPKCYKEIQENWSDVAVELGHEVLLFQSLQHFKTEFEKPENINKVIAIIIISQDQVKGDLISELKNLKEKYKSELLLSVFDDPLKPIKKIETLPVQNIIFKPFDLTILKEHTRFAILRGQKLKPLYVHTTQSNTEIESLKKFKILQLSEFAFKIDKAYNLEINKCYKFYHPLFANKKGQHAWGRVINSAADHYELMFAQTHTTVLSQLRRKVASSTLKVKNSKWIGLSENKNITLSVALQLQDEALQLSLRDLFSRNFKDISFIGSKLIDPKHKVMADVVITDIDYDAKQLESQFIKKPMVIRIFDKDLEREDLEKRFDLDFIRMEKPVDKALLVKMFKLCFPLLEENDEEIHRITIQLNETTSLAEVLKIQDFSEAAITFTDVVKHDLGVILDIALPQDDEINLQEIKARVNFASERPNGDKEKAYSHQFVLFGMRDEYLKLIRLWALQKHIDRKK